MLRAILPFAGILVLTIAFMENFPDGPFDNLKTSRDLLKPAFND